MLFILVQEELEKSNKELEEEKQAEKERQARNVSLFIFIKPLFTSNFPVNAKYSIKTTQIGNILYSRQTLVKTNTRHNKP